MRSGPNQVLAQSHRVVGYQLHLRKLSMTTLSVFDMIVQFSDSLADHQALLLY